MYKFSQRSLNRLYGIDHRLIELAQRSIELSPIDFGIPPDGGLRTAERQNELFKDRKSKLDGYIKIGNHQRGKAFDVYAYVNGNASWDKQHLAIIAGVVLSVANSMGLKIRWGGTFGSNDFKGWDYPHFEII